MQFFVGILRGWGLVYNCGENPLVGLAVAAATVFFSPCLTFDGFLGAIFSQLFGSFCFCTLLIGESALVALLIRRRGLWWWGQIQLFYLWEQQSKLAQFWK